MRQLAIEYWEIERLHTYDNPLRENDHAVGRMTDVLKRVDFLLPVLVESDGTIIDGHLRYKAALAMGVSTLPVIVIADLSADEIIAVRILVNRSATWATWDEDALLREMQKLVDANFDLSFTGFEQREIDAMLMELVPQGDKDPDAVPDTPDKPLVRDGDIWLLGRHRLLCGDSTSAADMRRLMDGKSAHMVWTDPPYNVDYSGKAGKIKNDKMTAERFDTFLNAAHKIMFETLAKGGAIYVAHSEAGDGMAFRRAFMSAGFKLASCLIWCKNAAVLGRGDYHHQHEPILYGWRPGAAHKWYGNRKQKTIQAQGLEHFVAMEDGSYQLLLDGKLYRLSGDALLEEVPNTVIYIPRPARSNLHPTTKPVALIETMIANSSPLRGIVLDPFGGSGSTLMACEVLGRSCYTLELDPRFAEVIIRRWQEFTDLVATRERDGATLQDIPHD
ncbi:MAG: DNA modification methylase [Pseudomonadota bacterium]